jgi:hypothetical protein
MFRHSTGKQKFKDRFQTIETNNYFRAFSNCPIYQFNDLVFNIIFSYLYMIQENNSHATVNLSFEELVYMVTITECNCGYDPGP